MWYWEGYAPPHAKERILPFGMMELNINLTTTPLTVYYPEQPALPYTANWAMVCGPRSNFFYVDTSCPASILSVWFKSGGAHAFFGVSAAELHNAHIPLHDIWGRAETDALTDRLLYARTPSARFALLEDVLTSRLLSAQQPHRVIGYALAALATPSGGIAQIERDIALSPPRFIEVFREEVGMTPKLYSRVQRFQRAAQMIARGVRHGLADIALAAGYYDQAHLVQDFRRFAGITPTEYRPQDPDHHSNLAVSD